MYRLLHEICELGSDAYGWRARMLAAFRDWLDVSVGMAFVLTVRSGPADIDAGMPLFLQLGENDTWTRYISNISNCDLSTDSAILKRFGSDFTCARHKLNDDATWDASAHLKRIHEAVNMDQTLYSQVVITPPGLIAGISLGRRPGKPAFSVEDVALVRFAQQELARLWRRPDAFGLHTLPARQREVLKGIRHGETRKEIAVAMGVSEHTVHDYERALYHKAGVTSRGMLLARLAKQLHPALLP